MFLCCVCLCGVCWIVVLFKLWCLCFKQYCAVLGLCVIVCVMFVCIVCLCVFVLWFVCVVCVVFWLFVF